MASPKKDESILNSPRTRVISPRANLQSGGVELRKKVIDTNNDKREAIREIVEGYPLLKKITFLEEERPIFSRQESENRSNLMSPLIRVRRGSQTFASKDLSCQSP